MEISEAPSRGETSMRGSSEDDDPSSPMQEARRTTGWASAAKERRNGQIGNGLLQTIEARLGSIA